MGGATPGGTAEPTSRDQNKRQERGQGKESAPGGGGALPDFFFFSCSADHERDWPPCKVVFRVGNQCAECEKQQQQQQQHPLCVKILCRL